MMEKNGERGLVTWVSQQSSLVGKNHLRDVDTAKAHASVRMREQAAVFSRKESLGICRS